MMTRVPDVLHAGDGLTRTLNDRHGYAPELRPSSNDFDSAGRSRNQGCPMDFYPHIVGWLEMC